VSPGNLELVQVVTAMLVSPMGFAAIVLVDERRLKGPRLARAWLTVSRDATIFGASQFSVMYGCLGLIIHFTKTRWSLAGFGLGLLWAVALFGLYVSSIVLVTEAIDWLGL
jgi:hypothetical protein